MAKKWIKEAIKHPGALHKKLHAPLSEKIPAKKLTTAKKRAAPGSKLAKELTLAKTLSKMHKKKK